MPKGKVMRDLRGVKIEIGDTVVFGMDNGSTLVEGTVDKLTAYVWMGRFRRDPKRVAVVAKPESKQE